MQSKRWLIKPEPDPDCVAHLQEVLGVSPILARLLAMREVKCFDSARDFFRPSLDMLHDPMLMKDMDKAVARILRALDTEEKILVYGDYDVDGTTSVALMYSFLKEIGVEAGYYVPDRYKEGYGISFEGIDYASEHGYGLIVALDCGIKSVDKVQYASERGIDFVICDHHLPGAEIPGAAAVLDPKRNDCDYPYKELSGCGIGFKLIQALATAKGLSQETLLPYLDLVVVSIGADIVPLTGENRVLAYFGLQQLNTSPRPGLAALIEVAKTKSALNITNVVFLLGPRINAAGRIYSAMDAVKLLVSPDRESAVAMAKTVDGHNLERREKDTEITQQAVAMLEEELMASQRKSTVLFNQDWNKGVIGIVASRLIERFYRPTILLTAQDGKATGSARSVMGFDVYEAIEACSDLLTQFGGHKYAAGLTLPVENVPAFRERFEAEVARRILEEQLTPCVEIDSELSLGEINHKFFRILNQFEPFGPGNLSPTFCVKGVIPTHQTRAVGKDKEHLSFVVEDPANPSCRFKGIAFGMGSMAMDIAGVPIDLAFHIEENEFRGVREIQLRAKDIRISQ